MTGRIGHVVRVRFVLDSGVDAKRWQITNVMLLPWGFSRPGK